MSRIVLMGDEAIAQAALDAGLSGVYAYPGTPSTEITEYIQNNDLAKSRGLHSDWSANEKTAMEAALGMSYAGKRVMTCMKHVGLNVAADAFVNSGMTGVNGGLVLVVADDPSMHSSQNEQDSRFYGDFAMIPVLEPASQQEAYDMTRYAFDLSEQVGLPVMLRITTRLAHSRSGVERGPQLEEKELILPSDPSQFVLLPAFARKRYKILLSLQGQLELAGQESGFNREWKGKEHALGIITCGLAYNYYREVEALHGLEYPLLKISQYPLSGSMLRSFASKVDAILVMEEGAPILEKKLKGVLEHGKPVKGRLDGSLPRDGELNPNLVSRALDLPVKTGPAIPGLVAGRPPAMCKGCSHIDMYNALNEAMEPYGPGHVFSDIGCYTLGALPPYNAINSCVDMGASVTMAKGASDAGLRPAVAVIGDSTFTHSGMTGLLDAVIEQTPLTLIISDNSTTGMTGGQPSHATNRLMAICRGLGVEEIHLRLMNPLHKHHEENRQMIEEELAYEGVSVILSQRECIQTAGKGKGERGKGKGER